MFPAINKKTNRSVSVSKKTRVAASQIGQAAWCGHAASLRHKAAVERKKSGKPQERSELMIQGELAHQKLTRATERANSDKRCFVASYALGQEHPATHSLRIWRESTLLNSAAGRGFVKVYYAASPVVIAALGRFRLFKSVSTWTVLLLARAFAGYQEGK